MKEWQTFVRRFSDMKEGDRELFIKDLSEGKTKYNTRHVMATVSKNKIKGGDILWVRGESGEKAGKPWSIKIKKEIEEYISGKPWEDLLEIMAKNERTKG
ncbi:MAG: phenylphosphate carboxylase subunit gamma [Thermodesulfobacteriota bacterium]